ncbi:MAG: exodeoxyribonuclease III [Janthinobacterium lividum]
MKIATWNINSVKIRTQHLLDFISEVNPDILMLQELKCETDKFPYEELSHLPYNLYVHGQKSYNGVAILSKFRADEVIYNFPSNPLSEQSRFLEVTVQTPIGFCRIICLYAPNGGEAYSDKFEAKLQFFDSLNNYLESIKTFEEKLIIGGDFNISPFDMDVHSVTELEDKTCFTLVERDRLRALLNLGFEDQFRLLNPQLQEFSWWDYRSGAFEHNKGMRIDMILTSANATGNFSKCYIDYEMRAKIKPSDHAPVILY